MPDRDPDHAADDQYLGDLAEAVGLEPETIEELDSEHPFGQGDA